MRKETVHLNKTKKALVYINLYMQNNLTLSYLTESWMIPNEFWYLLKSSQETTFTNHILGSVTLGNV